MELKGKEKKKPELHKTIKTIIKQIWKQMHYEGAPCPKLSRGEFIIF